MILYYHMYLPVGIMKCFILHTTESVATFERRQSYKSTEQFYPPPTPTHHQSVGPPIVLSCLPSLAPPHSWCPSPSVSPRSQWCGAKSQWTNQADRRVFGPRSLVCSERFSVHGVRVLHLWSAAVSQACLPGHSTSCTALRGLFQMVVHYKVMLFKAT